MRLSTISLTLCLFSVSYAAPVVVDVSSSNSSQPLPLVIWHGLGDSFDSDGISSVADLFTSIYPDTFVYSVRLAPSGSSDRSASFFGDVNTQLAQVCDDLAAIAELKGGFNAIGFSQGGQFLRGYAERCNSPPVRTLVTFGSQHNGISSFLALCKDGDWVCKGMTALLRANRWSHSLVPAQYYRDPEELDEYLEKSHWLADINNEREVKNQTYKENIMSLERMVNIMFADDKTVVPKESAFWAEKNATTGEITWLGQRDIYKEDWLGLKSLDDRGRLEFLEIPGEHMQIEDETLVKIFTVYMGPKGKNGAFDDDDYVDEDEVVLSLKGELSQQVLESPVDPELLEEEETTPLTPEELKDGLFFLIKFCWVTTKGAIASLLPF